MVELQFLNYLIEKKDWSLVTKNKIDETVFVAYNEAFMFIKQHKMKYGNVPDFATVASGVEDFESMEVNESATYMVRKLKEQKLHAELVPFTRKLAEKVAGEDAVDVVQWLKNEVEKMKQDAHFELKGTNWAKTGEDRWNDFKSREGNAGMLGIPTGFDFLDNLTHGLCKTELITILGYLGEGKSWLMLYFAMTAWKNGFKVLFFSLEMSEIICGYRLDTLNTKVSNTGMMTGNLEGQDRKDFEDYLAKFTADAEVPNFDIITATDLEEGLTGDMVETFIDELEPDIVFIDQLSLMKMVNKDVRVSYVQTTRKLKQLAMKKNVCIVLALQANRTSKKKEKGEESKDAPAVDTVAESNAPAEDSDKMFSIKKLDNLAKIAVIKNRMGSVEPKGKLCMWNIDKGIIKEMKGEVLF